MSGFEVRNDDGIVTVNSDYTSPLFSSYVASPRMDTVGGIDGDVPGFGRLRELAPFLDEPNAIHQPGQLNWFRMPVGGWGLPGASWFVPGKVNLAKTRTDVAVQSGFMDVFDSSGKLIWSAKSAATMPRILGFLTIPPNYDLQNNTLTIAVSGTPFMPLESFMGAISEDQEGVGAKNGIVIKQQSGSVILRYINQNGKNYTQTPIYSKGYKIPYGVIPNL